MRSKKVLNVMLAISLITLIGCGEGGGSSSIDSNSNKAPIVNVGNDIIVIVNRSITLVGTATDEDGTISSYEWKKGDDVLGTELSLTYTPTKVGTDTLTFEAMDDDGESSRDTVDIIITEEKSSLLSTIDLPSISKSKLTLFQKDSDEAKIIKGSIQNLSWAYYTDKNSKRWYISPVDSSNKVVVYSLMDFKDGKNGWGTVGENVASFNLQNETVSIGYISDNPKHRYFDAGWDEWNIDPKIQRDIEYIRNSTVSIKWWFFQASNGSWYIINKNGDTWRFSSKVKNGERVYDWIDINMNGAKPTFFIDNGAKKMRFESTNNNPSLTPYPAPELSSKYYKSENAFYVSNTNLKGECTWYSYGRVVELYNKGVISKKAYDLVYKLWGKSGRHARYWSSKIGISGQGFPTNDKVLPVDKRKRGLLAIWECGDFGHVGFVEEIGGANKEWYKLSDSNRGGKHKYKTAKYSFDSFNVVSGTSDDKLKVYGGVSCYPTFYDLEK